VFSFSRDERKLIKHFVYHYAGNSRKLRKFSEEPVSELCNLGVSAVNPPNSSLAA
jgi:hypothetical protein